MNVLCRIVGHDVVGGVVGQPIAGHPGPEPHYACQRCHHALWFWKGQRTGWFTEPEPLSNAYRGVNYRRLVSFQVVCGVMAFLIWYLWR